MYGNEEHLYINAFFFFMLSIIELKRFSSIIEIDELAEAREKPEIRKGRNTKDFGTGF